MVSLRDLAAGVSHHIGNGHIENYVPSANTIISFSGNLRQNYASAQTIKCRELFENFHTIRQPDQKSIT